MLNNKILNKKSLTTAAAALAAVSVGAQINNNTVHADTIQDVNNDVNNAKQALAQGQANNAQIDQAKSEAAAIPASAASKQNDIANDSQAVSSSATQVTKASSAASSAANEVAKAQEDRDAAKSSAQPVQDAANKANSTASSAASDVKQAQNASSAASQAVVNNQKATETTKQDLAKTVDDYNTQVNKINDLNTQITQTTNDAKALDTQVADAQKAQAQSQAKADNAYQALTQAQAKYNDAKKAYGDKAAALDETNSKIANETQALDANKADLEKLNQNLVALQNALSQAQKDYDDANKANSEATTRLNDLTAQANELQNKLVAAQSELNSAKQALNDAETADDDQIVLSDTYKNNVKTMHDMQGHDSAKFYDLDESDSTWAALRKEASDTSWALSHFKDNEADEKENVDLYNVTPQQQLRLTLYAARLINNVRMQLGTPLITVNSDAIEMAKEIADGYNADNRTNPDGQHHDNRAINQVSADWGISHGKAMTTGGDIDQYIEDMSGFYPGYDMVEGNDYQSSGFTTTGYGPEDQQHISMNKLKSYIYYNLKQMILEPDEWGHMRSITAALGPDADSAKRGPVYFGFSTNYKEGLGGGSTHFIFIPDFFVQKDSKFNKNATVEVPSTSDLSSDVNAKQGNVDSINNDIKNTALNIDQANSNIADAQNKANDANSRIADNNAKISTTNNSIAGVQDKIDANNSKLNDLNALKKALQDDSPVLYQMYVETGDALKTAQTNSDAANSDLASKKTATNKTTVARDNAYKILAAEQSALKTTTDKANADSAKKTELVKTLANLEKQAPILVKAANDAAANLDKANKALDDAQAKADKANADLKKAQAVVDAKQAVLNEAKAKADAANKALDEAKSNAANAQAQLDSDTAALAALNNRLDELNSFLATASYANIDALQARVKAAQEAQAELAKRNQIKVSGNKVTISTPYIKQPTGFMVVGEHKIPVVVENGETIPLKEVNGRWIPITIEEAERSIAQENATSSNNTLPQTGSNTSNNVIILALGAVLSLFGLGLGRKKRED